MADQLSRAAGKATADELAATDHAGPKLQDVGLLVLSCLGLQAKWIAAGAMKRNGVRSVRN